MGGRKKKKVQAAPGEPPRIHEATLASGPSGAVVRGAEMDLPTAISRRQRGEDVVVCGNNVKANGRLAQQIESAVGPAKPSPPHKDAGPHALPHFQPVTRPPAGHTFYETDNPKRKARVHQP
jgi:hypothetical protein